MHPFVHPKFSTYPTVSHGQQKEINKGLQVITPTKKQVTASP